MGDRTHYEERRALALIRSRKMNLVNYISLMRFEAVSLGVIVLLLLLKIFSEKVSVSVILGLVNLSLLVILVGGFIGSPDGSIFGGMFLSNKTFMLEKSILAFAALLVSLQANYWLKTNRHVLEFYLLLFSVLTGMFFLLSSGNFLMFYLSLELSTIPLAALAAFDFGRMRSAEGAGKMILSSAFSSAILLFGLSLLYGITGSLDFIAVSESLFDSPLLLFAIVFTFIGFAFKISVVPFHLWTADVYEGSPVSVTTFLSVVSKGAAIFILLTVLYKVFGTFYETWVNMLILLSAITMTVGNLFALRQNNIKRFLAFSSITQAGYILIGVAAASQQGMASALYFILIYAFSNIGAFTVVSVISERTGKETMESYKGLYATHPLLSIVMLLALFSLAGIPPTAGFFGKFFLLASGASAGLLPLVVIASLNLIVSLYYYLKIIKAMFVDKNENPMENFSCDLASKIVLAVCTTGILATGFFNFVFQYIYSLSFGP